MNIDSISLSKYEDGKSKYKELELYSANENYGKCWISAVEEIKTGCHEFTEETHAKMALAYLNCFLEMQGRRGYVCSDTDPVQSCTQQLSDSDRSNYATFFTHTHSICYFLQSQVWHEKTQATIQQLSLSSAQVADQLEESGKLQQRVIERQNQSLKNQETILGKANNLSKIINTSSENIHEMLSDFQKTSTEQRLVINNLFDRIAQIQTLVTGETSTIYSLVYYISVILIAHFLTSTARTSGARLWLFGLMILSMVVEWLLVSYVLKVKELPGTFQEQADSEVFHYSLIWYWRKFSAVLGVCVLVYKACRYKDIHQLNNQHLQDLRTQFTNFSKVLKELVEKTSQKEVPKSQDEQIVPSEVHPDVGLPTQETGSHIVPIQEHNHQSSERPARPKKGSNNPESHSDSNSSRSRRSKSRRSLERELKSLEVSGSAESKQELLKNWTKSGFYSPRQPAIDEGREIQDVHEGHIKSSRPILSSFSTQDASDHHADNSSDISLRSTKRPYSLRARKRNNTAS